MNLRKTLAAALGALLGALVVTLGLAVAAPPAAYACSCALEEPAVLVGRADAVLVGEFTARRAVEPGPDENGVVSSADFRTEYDLRVDEVLLGDPVTEITIHSSGDSAGCGLDFADVGVPWVVLAWREGGELHTGLCSGSGPVEHAPMDELRAAAEPAAQPIAAPGTPVPTSVPAGAVEGEPVTGAEGGLGTWIGGGLTLLALAGGGAWAYRHRISLIPRQR